MKKSDLFLTYVGQVDDGNALHFHCGQTLGDLTRRHGILFRECVN